MNRDKELICWGYVIGTQSKRFNNNKTEKYGSD